ncbi:MULTISPECIES: DUF6297 family protein [unclassified Pseudactinotalea]|uniref:DUF6297 family protein n=1 Tax=unclassified Pseudactinotalea TaxID=2649176 RepID=UPI003C7DA694
MSRGAASNGTEAPEGGQWPPPPQEALSGVDLRRLTRQATEAHGGGRISELVGEVYSVLVAGAIAWLVVIGAVQALGMEADTGQAPALIEPGWLALAAATLAAGVVVSLFARLGPMAMGAGHATWWLPMPADRSGMLHPRLLAMPAAGMVLGVALGAVVGVLADPGDLFRSVVWSMVSGGVAGIVAVLVCVAGQIRLGVERPRRVRPLVVTGDALVAAGPMLALVAALLRPPPLNLVGALPPATAILGVAAVLLLWWCWRRLSQVGGSELRQRGAVTGAAAGSVLSLDTRELGRALSVPGLPRTRRRSASFGWVRGPVLALITGDAITMLRNPRHLIQAGMAVAIALVPLVAGAPLALAVVAFVIAGYLAALATGEGARLAEVAPVLDRTYPLGAAMVRRVRVVWPVLVLGLWCLVVTTGWALAYEDWQWVPLGLVAAPTLAAGVLRAAYRKPPDWGMPLVPGPAGPMAPGVVTAFSRGPDVVVLCLIPLLVAALATGPGTTVLFIQMATSAVALSIACYLPAPDRSPGGEGGVAAQRRG